MGNWAKVWLAASLLGLVCVLSACGKDSGQGSVQANTAPPKNCWNGQCNWGANNYPSQWQAYPRYANGTYNYYGAYSNSGCGQYGANYYAVYNYNNGLICVPMNQNVNSYWQGTWAGGSYFQGCDMLYQYSSTYANGYANPCYGRCVASWQTNSQWGASWNTGAYARYGVCQ